jgi:hypothetical protein
LPRQSHVSISCVLCFPHPYPFTPSQTDAGSTNGQTAGLGRTSLVGLAIQFLSEMCEALRLCLAQVLMCNIKLHQFEVLRQMSSSCIVFLGIGIWALEWKRFADNMAWLRILEHPHWYLLAGAAFWCTHCLCRKAVWHVMRHSISEQA